MVIFFCHLHTYNQFKMDMHLILENTAHLLYELDKKVMVILQDGKTFIGYLRSVDQFATFLLESAVQRIYVGNNYGDVPKGSFIVRGENIVLIGEIDGFKEDNLPLIKIPIEDILEAYKKDFELKVAEKKNLVKLRKERGLTDY